MKKLKTYIVCLFAMIVVSATAQCTFRNTAFSSGEYLTYNLYYNWKFIWVKAGTASWYTVSSTYKGIPAYRAPLTTRGNGKLDDYFILRDTLFTYNSKQMEPLYFRKGAREGKRYTADEIFYTYPNGRCKLRQHRINNEGKHQRMENTYDDCRFDMMSIFLRARSFNPENWKKGEAVKFSIADGNSRHAARIVYGGKENIKADNNHKYRCLRFTYYEYEDEKWREIANFYATDDSNHILVRPDMSLKFGLVKTFLVSMKGINSPITSEIK